MWRDNSLQVAALREMEVTAEEGPEADAEKEARKCFATAVCVVSHAATGGGQILAGAVR
jgi:hypothetical protein